MIDVTLEWECMAYEGMMCCARVSEWESEGAVTDYCVCVCV
jgi:hypothetical protein